MLDNVNVYTSQLSKKHWREKAAELISIYNEWHLNTDFSWAEVTLQIQKLNIKIKFDTLVISTTEIEGSAQR